APVDPGIPVLELLAWLLEQRLFKMDQISDSMVRASFRLLGDRLRGATAATTVMRFDNVASQTSIARQTPLVLEAQEPVIFSTRSPATLLPLLRLQVLLNEVDRTQELEQERVVRTLEPCQSQASIRIVLWLRNPPAPAQKNDRFTLLFELHSN